MNIKHLACLITVLFAFIKQASAKLTPSNQQIVRDSWKQYFQNLDAVAVNNKPIIELLGTVLKHNFSISYDELSKGLVYKGAGYRLRKVVSKLMQGGELVKFGVIGGSITFVENVDLKAHNWWTKVSRYVTSAFSKSRVIYHNGAIPATAASYALMCLQLMLEEDVDIVFLEYTLNDGFMDSILHNNGHEVFEKLIRKILNKPHKPAVVLMQVPATGLGYKSNSSYAREFHHTPEDLYGSLAQYYDISWLSMRDVYWRLGHLHKDGYKEEDFYATDYLHPGGPLGQRLMADLVVLLFQQTAIDLLIRPWNARDETLWKEPVSPPMHKGNYEPISNLCLHDESFKSVVISAEGFEFQNEGTGTKRKLGYVARSVGSRLVFSVNTKQPKLLSPREKENLLIAYLKSYEHMGTARVECIAGCTCEAKELQGHHSGHNSQIFLMRLFPTPAENCTISITVQEKTLSGEHKVKVTGVMIDSYSAYYEGHWATSTYHAMNDKNKQSSINPGS